MKILALRGKNLASLAPEFEIDFRKEPLASAGLFAICGPTGAGKSTLLDALCVALYGDTPRLRKAAGRGVNLPDVADETIAPHDVRTLLRRGAAEGYAEVDFLANDNTGYRARWSVRRSRARASGKLQNSEMSLMRIADRQSVGNGKTEVIEAIQSRLGLTFEQFTRAVLLAQNEFFEFLKANDNERAALLETLTGTDAYGLISIRVFNRAKTEGDQLALLRRRLQDQQPLPAEERTGLEREAGEAGVRLQGLEHEKTSLERHLSWHLELDGLKQAEEEALAAFNAAEAGKKKSETRRIEFERIEHVRNAGPLTAEADRTRGEVKRAEASLDASRKELAKNEAARQEAEAGLAHARQSLSTAEGAKMAAAGDLGRARDLDAKIEAVQSQLLQMQKDLEQARLAEKASRAERDAREKMLTEASQKRDAILDWIAANEHLRPLAENWPKWDTLFRQAGEAAKDLDKADRELAAAEADHLTKTGAAAKAAATLQDEATQQEKAEALLKAAEQALGSFRPDDAAAARTRTSRRLEHLNEAQALCQRLREKEQRNKEVERQAEGQRKAVGEAEEELASALRLKPLLEASLNQAERSCDAARLASAENVEKMRGLLGNGKPCPVCGSTEHPYLTHDPGFRSVLGELEREVAACRARMAGVERREASSRTRIESGKSLLAGYAQELQRLSLELGKDHVAWSANPVAPDLAGVRTDDRPAWLDNQARMVRAEIDLLDGAEKAYHRALQNRGEAQQLVEVIRGRYQAAGQALNAQTSLRDIAAANRNAASEKRNALAGRLKALLAELDPVVTGPGLRTEWEQDPDEFRAGKREEAECWSGRIRESEQLKAEIGKIGIELAGLHAACATALDVLSRQEEVHRRGQEEIERLRGDRLRLFEGKRAVEVEAALDKAIEQSRKEEETAHDVLTRALSAQARAQEASLLGERNLLLRKEERARAERNLSLWLDDYNRSGRDSEMLTVERLRQLVAHDGLWIAAERGELRRLDDEMQRAETLLAERKSKRERHEEARPTPDDQVTVRAALAELAGKLKAEQVRTTELIVKLRQDDDRIAKSAEAAGDIAAQEARERVWAQLNELIGSADGKKFRNFAQQYTLDVLLGYANRHLAELSRRYRLERVKDTLAMLIVDQDMGDERRSVHSLSGGESFLVSLALALGLASLSSNRVRVESLFIDEGFGSLDPGTLMVAMDALDNLQAQGRKVGVISHVQEMSERIGTQIRIKLMSGGQSRVEVAGI